jgi:hypothetical protein
MIMKRAELREMLGKYFSESDLRELCFDLEIDDEGLARNNKNEMIIDLILYCKRENRLDELIDYIRFKRPWFVEREGGGGHKPGFEGVDTSTILQGNEQEALGRLGALAAALGEGEGGGQASVEPAYRAIVEALIAGSLVPFLGPDANMCGRQPEHLGKAAPNDHELAAMLVELLGDPLADPAELPRVAQHLSLLRGKRLLYDKLLPLLAQPSAPTPLHQFLALLPAVLRGRGYPARPYLVVTTGYDTLLEQAFQAIREPYDVVAYVAAGEHRGKFVYRPYQQPPRLIGKPNEENEIGGQPGALILKLRGSVTTGNMAWDRLAVTEDHHIDYLSQAPLNELLPVKVLLALTGRHLLFLGYRMRDWHLRAILWRIFWSRGLTPERQWWAIQQAPHALDDEFYRERYVKILDAGLETALARLGGQLLALPAVGVRAG